MGRHEALSRIVRLPGHDWLGWRATSDGTWEFLFALLPFPQKFTCQIFIYSHDVSYSQRLPKGALLITSNCALDLEQSATLDAPPGLITRSASSLCVESIELSGCLFWWRGGGVGAVSLSSSKHHNMFPPASAGPMDRSAWSTMTQRLAPLQSMRRIPVLRSSLPISVDSQQLEGDPHCFKRQSQ